MADVTFNTPSGQTIARELMILYLNTGTSSSPTWSPLGSRVEDSSMEFDWADESSQDVLGKIRNTMKKPVITQSFDPLNLDSGDSAIVHVWNLAVKEQNPQALCNQDILIVHHYGGASATPFAERYPSSMVKPTGLGGPGGGNIEMPVEVTYGGKRQVGTASVNTSGTVTFTAAS